MPRARSLAVLVALTTLSGPASAFAQGSGGAGDNQYQDPFSGGKTSGSSSTTHKSSSTTTSATTSQSGGLSQNPNLGTPSASSGASSSSTPSSTATAPASAAAGTLPNTGSDPRLIVLAGLALLLFGIGLRLRTADERF